MKVLLKMPKRGNWHIYIKKALYLEHFKLRPNAYSLFCKHVFFSGLFLNLKKEAGATFNSLF